MRLAVLAYFVSMGRNAKVIIIQVVILFHDITESFRNTEVVRSASHFHESTSGYRIIVGLCNPVRKSNRIVLD